MGTPLGRTLLNIAVTLVFAAVYFYIVLPPISLKSEDFYVFVLLVCAVYGGCAILTSGFQGHRCQGLLHLFEKTVHRATHRGRRADRHGTGGRGDRLALFRAGDYRDLLTVTDGDFAAEVEEISYDQIPMLDANSATKLGNRKLGELADMVSQFEVADDYTQINYQGRPVRVTPLRYGDIIKWLNNRADGLPAYLLIDMVTQNVEVIRLDEGIRYTTAEHFSRNLYRHLRFHYPTYMFDKPAFEIDENGDPWWVCPRVSHTIGLFGGRDIIGAVLVNAVTGESTYYKTRGRSLLGRSRLHSRADHAAVRLSRHVRQRLYQLPVRPADFTVTTDGYNYIAIGDDVYMYTGVTSVVSDESNIGFILSNQRTKETRFYPVAGAKEYSAMDSAQGQVQQMKYTATFPLLLNISDQPTYFMALKDAAELVKMYAMVNVSQYQIVATGDTVASCEANYRRILAEKGLVSADDADLPLTGQSEASGVLDDIRSAVVDGNTLYYLHLTGDSHYYVISAAVQPEVVIYNTGDYVTIRFADGEGTILTADSAERTAAQTAPALGTDTKGARGISPQHKRERICGFFFLPFFSPCPPRPRNRRRSRPSSAPRRWRCR